MDKMLHRSFTSHNF